MLQRGEIRGYDFNRMIFEFTMLNQGKVILCAISTAAMDDLEGNRDVKAHQRVEEATLFIEEANGVFSRMEITAG